MQWKEDGFFKRNWEVMLARFLPSLLAGILTVILAKILLR